MLAFLHCRCQNLAFVQFRSRFAARFVCRGGFLEFEGYDRSVIGLMELNHAFSNSYLWYDEWWHHWWCMNYYVYVRLRSYEILNSDILATSPSSLVKSPYDENNYHKVNIFIIICLINVFIASVNTYYLSAHFTWIMNSIKYLNK